MAPNLNYFFLLCNIHIRNYLYEFGLSKSYFKIQYYDENCFQQYHDSPQVLLVIVFAYFGVFRPTREFSTKLETSPLPMKGCNFELCLWPLIEE